MIRRTFLLAAAAVLAAVPARAEPRPVRIAYITSELSPMQIDAELFAKAVEQRLPGAFQFKLYPNGQLGKEDALIDGIQAGSLEMAVIASGMTRVVKKLGVFDLPWLFDDEAHVRRALSGPLGAEIVKQVEQKSDMIVLGIYENGFRHVINTKHPIATPADTKGLKIRVAGGKFRQQLFTSMGANPAPVDWTETFSAMQTGVVDGAEAAIYGFYEAKLYEPAKYLSLTKHIYSPTFLVVASSFYKALPAEQQKAFRDAGAAITDAAYEETEAAEKKYLAEMAKTAEINEVDLKAFRAATRKVIKDYDASQGDDWVKLIEAAR
jgi:tripartite ATP-independent transporter DctP family solute receptor